MKPKQTGLEGRLRESVRELERPGDYAVTRNKDGEVTALWMLLPRTGTQGRIAAVGHGVNGGPEWHITVPADGKVTVDPSIDEGGGGYHGFLRDGVWSNA